MNMRLFLLFTLFLISKFTISQITILSTDFQSGIPLNFSILNIDGNTPDASMTEFIGQEAFISLADPDSNANLVAAATSYFSPIDTANRWLITPLLNLGSFGNKITWKAKSHDPSFPDDYLVLLSYTDNQPNSFTDTIGSIEEENFEWTTRSVDLSQSGYDDSSVYIAFVLRTFDGYKLYFDDILVEKNIDTNSLFSLTPFNIQVYPNPVTSWLTIQGLQGDFKGVIKSFNGQIMGVFNEPSINVENFPPGIYFTSLNINNQIFNTRFLKN